MTIPLSTTTISVLRVLGDADRDPYEEQPAPSVLASGVRAVISTPRGMEMVAGGSEEVVVFVLNCDPTDIDHKDQIEDEKTSKVYEVVWARPVTGFGLDHVQAGLKQVAGLVSRAGR